jgi:hypothetical protein
MDGQRRNDSYRRAGDAIYRRLVGPFTKGFWRLHRPVIEAFELVWYHAGPAGYEGFWRLHRAPVQALENLWYHGGYERFWRLHQPLVEAFGKKVVSRRLRGVLDPAQTPG